MVTIKKNYPLVVPPWKGAVEDFDLTTIGSSGTALVVNYSSYDWARIPVIHPGGSVEIPIRGITNDPNLPIRYPRSFAAGGEVTVDGATAALLVVNGIGGLGASSGGLCGWLTQTFEPNGYDLVDNGAGGSVVLQSTVNDRWQGGDCLIIQEYHQQSVTQYYHLSAPSVIAANADEIAHDQAQANAIQACFNRIKLIYWWFPALAIDPLIVPDVTSLYETIVGGVSNAEFHVASSQSEIDDSILPAVQAFFGV